MRIGILGSGQVGRALGRGYARHGHDVRIGSRDTTKVDLQTWARETGGAVEQPAQVARWAELVVLATAGTAAVAVIGAVAEQVAGKVVIDATNPLDYSSGVPQLSLGFSDSLGEQVQRAAPAARIVKAYNTVGNTLMVDPELQGRRPTMFIGGEDAAAKAAVSALLDETGWDVEDLGGIDAARLLEPMCLVWVRVGARTGQWDHAFALIRPS